MNAQTTLRDTGARAEIYDRLARRNRIIGLLRIGVPIFGLLVLGLLVVQIVIANIGRDLGISGLRVSRDALVVDTPAYAGVMSNGTQYRVAADTATTPISGGDIIALEKAVLNLERLDGYEVRATADVASFSLSEQTVDVADVLIFTDSRNTNAQLRNTTIDWSAQTLVARDNVYIVFGDGSLLTASQLVYDAEQQTWDFKNVKLTLPIAEEDR